MYDLAKSLGDRLKIVFGFRVTSDASCAEAGEIKAFDGVNPVQEVREGDSRLTVRVTGSAFSLKGTALGGTLSAGIVCQAC